MVWSHLPISMTHWKRESWKSWLCPMPLWIWMAKWSGPIKYLQSWQERISFTRKISAPFFLMWQPTSCLFQRKKKWVKSAHSSEKRFTGSPCREFLLRKWLREVSCLRKPTVKSASLPCISMMIRNWKNISRKMKMTSWLWHWLISTITRKLWRAWKMYAVLCWSHWSTERSPNIFPISTVLWRSWRRTNISWSCARVHWKLWKNRDSTFWRKSRP